MFLIKASFLSSVIKPWAIALSLGLFIISLTLGLTGISPAQAESCRSFSGHRVCAVSLRRSAKHYWEYRTVISIDGVNQPLEVYNCRDRTRTLPSDGTTIAFATGKTGDWVCQLFKPTRDRKLNERVNIGIR
jgi:hypothetical protein